MRTFAAILALVTACAGLPASYIEANEALLWANFKQTYGKKYTGSDETARRAIFKRNMLKAAAFEVSNPKAQFGMNAYSDMSEEEFKVYHSLDASKRTPSTAARRYTDEQAKAATPVDWRTKGAVTQVKNQGQCGSCWSFSSTGNIEGQNFLAGNPLTSLSEQELVSCCKTNAGCGGGWQDNAFQWLQENHNGQIVTEASYPYTSGGGDSGSCEDVSAFPVGATISSHADVAKNEDEMAAWVSENGPLAIVVDATSFQSYQGGILSNCISQQVDHAVLIVGFSDEYWIIKNSWGTWWGENGYIRVEKGSNQCLLTYRPTSAHVTKKN